MKKLFLLAHPKKRFDQDCFTRVLSSTTSQTCRRCLRDFETSPETMEIAYYWDTEFEHPEASFEAGHECFWGGFRMIVSNRAKDMLSNLGELFVFSEAKEIPCDSIPMLVDTMKDKLAPYHWVRPKIVLQVDRTENKIEICSSCGKFRESPQQVTRIRVTETAGASAKCFTIQENRAFAIFVTEEFRLELESIDLKGIGFYPAGSLV